MIRLVRLLARYRLWLVCSVVVVSIAVLTLSTVTRRGAKEELKVRYDKLRNRFEKLEVRLAQMGESMTDRQVTAGTITLFIPYVQEDIEHNELKRAASELTSLESLLMHLEAVTHERSQSITFPKTTGIVGGEHQLKVQGGKIVPGNPDQSARPIFLTGYGVFQRLRDDIEKLPTVGANLIQVEIGPTELFPRPEVIDRTPLDRLLGVLNRAAKVGISVDVLISPHYFPEWMLVQEPALRRRRDSSVRYCIHHPRGIDFLRRYIRLVVEAIRHHPALLSVCLANEPQNIEEPCEFATRKWHRWLKTHHGGIAGFNSTHGTQLHHFEEIALPDPFRPPEDKSLWLDYIRFNQEDHADWLSAMSDEVHAVAQGLPVHIKATTPMLLGRTTKPAVGLDPTLLSRFTDLNGNDGYNFLPDSWESVSQAQTEIVGGWQENAMGHDLQKSLNPAPIFNSENHLIVDRESRRIPPVHIRTALWQAAVHGQSATTLWVWDRAFDHGHDFWGSILERPDALESVGHTNLDLNRAAIELSALQGAPVDVSILSSVTAQVWDNHVPAVTEALYTALSFTGLKIGFVTERQLEAGYQPTSAVLFVPGNVHLSRHALKSLSRYRGRLVFVGKNDLLSLDDHAQTVPKIKVSSEVLDVGEVTSWRVLWNKLNPCLVRWAIEPEVKIRVPQGPPLFGVEWRSVQRTHDEWLVNLCNYRRETVALEVVHKGQVVAAGDVLSGKQLPSVITLNSLETKLVRFIKW
jgi:hypothetical protein